MNIEDLQKRAVEIRELYDKLNLKERNVAWNDKDIMSGFVGDVGDLSKIIMAKNGLRAMEDVDEKLKHELSDCLWSILVLSAMYNIDISKEFSKTMDYLFDKVSTQLS